MEKPSTLPQARNRSGVWGRSRTGTKTSPGVHSEAGHSRATFDVLWGECYRRGSLYIETAGLVRMSQDVPCPFIRCTLCNQAQKPSMWLGPLPRPASLIPSYPDCVLFNMLACSHFHLGLACFERNCFSPGLLACVSSASELAH